MDAFDIFVLHANPASPDPADVERLCDYVLRLHATGRAPDRRQLIAQMSEAGFSAGMQNHVLNSIEFGRMLLDRQSQVH